MEQLHEPSAAEKVESRSIHRLYRLYLWVLPVLTVTLAVAVSLAIRAVYDRSEAHQQVQSLLYRLDTLSSWSGDLAQLLIVTDGPPTAVQDRLTDMLDQFNGAFAELERIDHEGETARMVAPAAREYHNAAVQLLASDPSTIQRSELSALLEQTQTRLQDLHVAVHTARTGLLTDQQSAWRDDMLLVAVLSLGAVVLLMVLISRFVKDRTSAELLLSEQRILRRSEERLQTLIRNSLEVLMILSADGRVIYTSPAVTNVMGYEPELIMGMNPLDYVHPEDHGMAQSLFRSVAKSPDGINSLLVRLRHADGTWRHVEGIFANLLADPNAGGILATFRDVTERAQVEAEMLRLAYHDELTDLPNRAFFRKHLDQALLRADQQGAALALLFLDLDNFKVINDSVGHQVGDQLLAIVAERLRGCLDIHDTAARLGGDEFVIVAQQVVADEHVLALADRVVAAVSQPCLVQGHEITPAGSVGVAVRQPGQDTADTLIRNADTAMYKAKGDTGRKIVLFQEWMNRDARARLDMEIQLRRALGRQEFELHYQPCIDLATGAIHEVEALIRWEHPTKGRISPMDFIPLAEETGQIHELGAWVLATACRQMQAWRLELPAAQDCTVNVNVSVVQLFHADFVPTVERILAESGLPPTRLRLEITESVIMHDTKQAVAILSQLKSLGLSLAIDDFGKGYSSLGYLKLLPIDVLKVDRTFVDQVGTDEQDAAIVKAIISLAKTLKLRVTAEGVETAEQARIVAAMGCDLAQGYYFSRPLPAPQVGQLLAAKQAVVAGD